MLLGVSLLAWTYFLCWTELTVVKARNHGNLRLVGGTDYRRGRVEIYIEPNNTWGIVCDDRWDTTNARVVCRQLGFGNSGTAVLTYPSPVSFNTPIWLDEVNCNGLEQRLIDCPHGGLENHDCSTSEDAGVTCTGAFPKLPIRLVEGTNTGEGRVEILYKNSWATVCDDGWDDNDASAVCRQLGLGSSGFAVSRAGFGRGTGTILLDEVKCTTGQSNIFECRHNGFENHDCSHIEDAGVRCNDSPINIVRLVRGNSYNEGRVEVNYNGEWGTVCDDGWDDTGAGVVCRQLGFGSSGTALGLARFGQGSGSIWLDSVICTGNESTLASCGHLGVGVTRSCSHSEDAGVRCSGTQVVPVRLSNGDNSRSGRVEMYINGEWGTVCDDHWTAGSSAVVCRQLGLGNTGTDQRYSPGPSHFPILLDDVRCVGNEANILACQHLRLSDHNCNHGEDIGVTCSGLYNAEIRLVNGANDRQGRVEIMYQGIWGTICDDGWDDNDATVVCRELGFSHGNATRQAQFGSGTGPVWLRQVGCTGSESKLSHCTHTGASNTLGCSHAQDVGVQCYGVNVRLVGGPTEYEGRVEVFYNGVWGTVCDDDWDLNDAQVVCTELGLGKATAALRTAFYGRGSGQIWLDNVNCVGTEETIRNCSHRGWGIENCFHLEDASVNCTAVNIRNGTVRLVGSTSNLEGRVEVFSNQQWSTVCDDGWDNTDAGVVCRQLGFGSSGTAIRSVGFGQGSGSIWLNNIICIGNESTLTSCDYLVGDNISRCNNSAGVRCDGAMPMLPIRLADGDSPYSGRVEIYRNGVWGTVCDDNWTDMTAQVVCQQLGFGSTSASVDFDVPAGTGPIFMDNVNCSNNEANLFTCSHSGFENHNCGHTEDVGVTCNPQFFPIIRLVGGSSYSEGQVEVNYNGEWGTVCDDGWDDTDAGVVCRQLGFGSSGTAIGSAGFGQGSGAIWLDSVSCTGSESTLASCGHFGVNITKSCSHAEDAGVRCSRLQNINIRLVGGSAYNKGRVEVKYNGQWGTVCDNGWDDTDAGVVCRQLGFGSSGTAVGSAGFGQGSGSIWLDSVTCTGNESILASCGHLGISITSDCNHTKDAGLRCFGGQDNTAIRLVGGSSYNEGRVEILYNDVWGTICSDGWSLNNAIVVCRSVGFSGANTFYATSSQYGPGAGPIWLDNVMCDGNESSLARCSHRGINITNSCTHAKDVGVYCSGSENVNIRLVGGSSYNQGRVEVNYNGFWGTVCDDGWDDTDAGVVCRQLGFGSSGTAIGSAGFGQGSGSIWLDSVTCSGDELALANCGHLGVRVIRSCAHSEDAGVRCSGGQDVAVRLVDGSTYYEGRVEVYYNGEWGTVCDDGWSTFDANVVCRQLGFSSRGRPYDRAHFGEGSGPVWLSNIACTNTESTLASCGHLGVNITRNCNHRKDAGVRCYGAHGPLIRLIGGNSYNEGRVEVNYNGQWGTVCDDGWDDTDAGVVCKQLGFGSSGTAIGSAGFGQGSGSIWLDSVSCTGSESTLASCGHVGINITSDCNHTKDAGVRCETQRVAVRLVGGSSYNEGRVEVNYNGEWGTVCDDGWSSTDAGVVCRQLGFGSSGTAIGSASFGQGSGSIWLDGVTCTGNESTLASCGHLGVGVYRSCSHSEDAGVRCLTADIENGRVRLVGGSSYNEGRVEVNYNGQWGTVCDDGWDDTDAGVVCRQLGFGLSGMAVGSAGFGQGSGSIWLDSVSCTGSESILASCGHSGVNITQFCNHNEDAGVRCSDMQDINIRLVGGSSYNEGRVEVNYNGEWGTVCDNGWDDTDAGVVCRQLGFGSSGTAIGSAGFGQGSGSILLDSVSCIGNESKLTSCNHLGINITRSCTHAKDAGIRCFGADGNTAIRLVGGSSYNEGRVEILYNDIWGTICSDGWSLNNAIVVCRSVGFSGANAFYSTSSQYGPGAGPIWLDNVMCDGNESSLASCSHRGINITNSCTHAKDVGVNCSGSENVNIRLVGGSSYNEGRVEVTYNGFWGAVCDDGWDDTDAGVVCRQLGFGSSGTAIGSAGFGQGSGSIWLDSVTCSGDELTLANCGHLGVRVIRSCAHSEDAGVRCSGGQDVAVRLVDGSTYYEGRVEVYYNGEWGTVCDDGWSTFDANVVCRQLGFSSRGRPYDRAHFGQGSGPVWLSNVACTNTELTLASCGHLGVNNIRNCNHKDAGVRCIGAYGPLIRLVGGGSYNEGRVELNYNGEWGTVCDDGWDDTDAGVVCRQLGFGSSGTAIGSAGFGQGSGAVLLDSVTCIGNEPILARCGHVGINITSDCNHTKDAGVRCEMQRVAFRLVGGSSYNEGRVEVNYNGEWGTVCDDGWDDTDAGVVCRQLGFGSSGTAIRSAGFGQGSGSIWLDSVTCSGNESTLASCGHLGVGVFRSCSHFEDAGVRCPTADIENGRIRLAGGSSYNEGRVEVNYNGGWGTVCDDGWDDTDAGVVCRQLGFGSSGTAIGSAGFGQGSGSIWLDSVSCTGSELTLARCGHSGVNITQFCSHNEDSGVRCRDMLDINIRLVGGNSYNEGRVEVNYNGEWGTVCDDGWDDIDAGVACRQLGFGSSGTAVGSAGFGQGSGSILLDSVSCIGNESTLTSCNHLGINITRSCTHAKDAGVRCFGADGNTAIRLVGGSSYNEGRVEILYNDVWGTICSDGWSLNNAIVVCRSVGFSGANTFYVTSSQYGPGAGPIWLDNVMCDGNESSLARCSHHGVNITNSCTHAKDVGVNCSGSENVNIRLVGGSSYNEGRVEVTYNGFWGTVCDDGWDDTDAGVVCRQLGFGSSGTAIGSAGFGQGSGSIWLDSVTCSGDELALANCGHLGVRVIRSCAHSEDAGVRCFGGQDVAVRLVNGSTFYEGRVEVYYNGKWGTVCDDGWSNFDANVVCRQLGFSSRGRPYDRAHFGPGSGPVWLSNVKCANTESTLASCGHLGVNITRSCNHQKDAGVRCIAVYGPLIRLIGGNSYNEGRVEVNYNGQWGTVCDDGWDDTDAGVVCRQLGFGSSGTAIGSAGFGQGSGSIWLDSVTCTGNESILASCGHVGINITNDCNHTKDAGVRCETQRVAVRLVGGSSYNEGRVEVNYNGEWGTVCDDGWSSTDAGVVCRQLGFGTFGVAVYRARFGRGSGSIWLDGVTCTGNESSLVSCGHLGVGVTRSCSHSEDAGVRCPTADIENGRVRLVGGSSYNEGRVEVNYNGEWGTVCDDGWDDTDAGVVCRQLGFGSSGAAIGSAGFGQGSGSIWLDSVTCTGNESTLASCGHSGVSITQFCSHNEDAGVRCSDMQDINIRLVGGSSYDEGRVEVNYNGFWGTVCDDGWDDTDAGVVCRQLGFGSSGTAIRSAGFGQGSGLILLDSVSCTGSESTLIGCNHLGISITRSCTHAKDAGVKCFGADGNTAVRLVGGSSYGEGRVEILYNDVWGTICSDGWSLNNGMVTCKSLGFNSLYVTSSQYGPGVGPIWLDNVMCDGSEPSLGRCSHRGVNITNGCTHAKDVGIRCRGVENINIRLVGGSSYNEGRVEVNYNGEWGTVCDDGWNDTDAGVVCRQLGFGSSGTAIGSAGFGQGSGSIWLDSVSCSGNELALAACGHLGVNVTRSCAHSKDAGVRCSGGQGVAVRLVNGSSFYEGRVEVFYNGEWGTVCDNGWGYKDVRVLCRQLGFGQTGRPYSRARFGEGSGPIWLGNVDCANNESTIASCGHLGINITRSCGHDEDAGVTCNGGQGHLIRLVGGNSYNEGRVEVNYNGEWGTVCDDGWDDTDAGVVCRQLGFGSSGTAIGSANFSQGSGSIFLSNILCNGGESILSSCGHLGINVTTSCSHINDAGIRCSESKGVLVRLVGGSSYNEGRVEVNYNGEWGTVCDDGWDDTDAGVLCRQLGFGSSGTAIGSAHFGRGSGSIWLDSVTCTGSESTLAGCGHFGVGISRSCSHFEDAGVRCSETGIEKSGKLRLVEGSSYNEGRVEVNYNGEWGTVCDDGWDDTDAGVVCRQLGFGSSGTAIGSAGFGQGSGSVLLSSINCTGNELTLTRCGHLGINITGSCNHAQDAGVRCSDMLGMKIRLVGGRSYNEGRVEVNYNGEWGTVCDDGWDDTDAGVVCRQLGFGSSGTAIGSAGFGQGSGSILLDCVTCTGSESTLASCGHLGVSLTSECDHNKDAGVRCIGGQGNTAIRLVGGSSYNEGRVEILYNDVWGTICSDGWSLNNAIVVCRSVGFSGANTFYVTSSQYGPGAGPIWLDNVMCDGNERTLARCGHFGVNITQDCTHMKDVGVNCSGLENVKLRLSGGSSYNEGRVEVNYNGEWGTVCDDGWDDTDAGVVCRQLGFGSSGKAVGSAGFGQGLGRIWLGGVTCSGIESNIMNCGRLSLNITRSCSHAKDSGVICSKSEGIAVRLVGGSSYNEGRVEVNYNGEWGTVCDDGWDDTDAGVVCRQLGIGYAGGAIGFGQHSKHIFLNDVTCTGSEATLVRCGHTGINTTNQCNSLIAAGASCYKLQDTAIRLVGGSLHNKGRVEVNYDGEWGTVCDDGWDDTDAGVVCRQLGFGSSGTAIGSATFGQGSGTIWLNGVTCTGNESTLTSCGHLGVKVTRKCDHSEDASVVCPSDFDFSVEIQQVNGSRKGRIEIYNNGERGLVCSNGWDAHDATVVCREKILGTNGIATKMTYNKTEAVWLNGVDCVGNESQLSLCSHNGIEVVTNCTFIAGVECFGGLPVIQDPPNDQAVGIVFGNEIVTFHCIADGEGLSYLWQRQDLELPRSATGNTTDTLVIRGVTEEDSGNYQCTVSNRFGVVSSDYATLTITISPPNVTIDPNSVTVKLYDTVTFLCSAVGLGDLLFKWESLNSVSTDERSLTLDSVLPHHQGQYQCTVTSSYSNLSSSAFSTLHIIAPSFDSRTASLQQIRSNASANTITVFIPQADDSGGPISHYYIVISLEQLEDTEAVKDSELLPANPVKRSADHPLYVTASVNYEDFRPTFIIGDGSSSTDPISQTIFHNVPLQKHQTYYYFIRAYSEAHTTEYPFFGTSPLSSEIEIETPVDIPTSQISGASSSSSSSLPIPVIAGVIAGVVIICVIILVIAIIVLRKRRPQPKKPPRDCSNSVTNPVYCGNLEAVSKDSFTTMPDDDEHIYDSISLHMHHMHDEKIAAANFQPKSMASCAVYQHCSENPYDDDRASIKSDDVSYGQSADYSTPYFKEDEANSNKPKPSPRERYANQDDLVSADHPHLISKNLPTDEDEYVLHHAKQKVNDDDRVSREAMLRNSKDEYVSLDAAHKFESEEYITQAVTSTVEGNGYASVDITQSTAENHYQEIAHHQSFPPPGYSTPSNIPATN